MDDDVLMPAGALEALLRVCQRVGPKNAISPLFKNCATGQYLTRYDQSLKELVRSLVATTICGAPWGVNRMGRIDRAGVPYAVDPSYCGDRDLVETEWLPGGCVICRQEDLVLDAYFPFSGKAYSEDVIHSLIWRQRGIRLWVATKIDCCTHIGVPRLTLQEMLADYRARAYVVRQNAGSLLRCRLHLAVNVLRHCFASLLFWR